jgi:predicted site-specific integrase-resolvase
MDETKKNRNGNIKEKATHIPIRKAAELTGVHPDTLRRWASKNLIKFYITPSGQRFFDKKCLLEFTSCVSSVEKKENIVYCRVSSKKQENDLSTQVEFLKSEYPDYRVVSDIGSGINWKRKGLQAILELAMQRKLGNLVVAHKDRLSRFAFELIEWIVTTNEGKIIVLDEENNKSSEQDLAEDLLSIVHIYSCKQMGKRRYKRKQSDEDTYISNKRTKNRIE